MVAQVSLFTGIDGEGFEEARQALEELNKGKRGHYNKDYTKPKVTDNKWQNLRSLQMQLANFLEVPYFFSEDEVFLFCNGRIKAWLSVYTEEEYTYQGVSYTGEAFKIREAEITGVDRLDIDTRLQLHKELVEDLENGTTLEKAVDSINIKLNELEYQKLGEFALWLRKHRD